MNRRKMYVYYGGDLEVDRFGKKWFVFDDVFWAKIMDGAKWWQRPFIARRYPLEPYRCGPTPVVPVFGGFSGPGGYCIPTSIPQELTYIAMRGRWIGGRP